MVYKEELNTKQEQTVKQQAVLENKLADLRSTLAKNQDQLKELNAKEEAIHAEEERKRVAAEQRKAAEEQRKAAEKEKEQEKVEVASAPKQSEQKKTNRTTTSSSQKSPAPSNENKENKENQENKNQSGSWMSIQSTGYSTQEPGLSTHTATGIDLRVNPRVIAVDPSVIPLGSLVEIQGLGIYVAAIQCGAINGRIIDIHFSTVSQAMSWGRRTVNVRIIN